MRVPEIINRYVKRVDAMTLRERVMVFIAAAFVLVVVANYALIDPILQRQKVNSLKNQQQQDEMRAMQAQLQAFAQARLSESASAKRQRLEKLKAELAALDRDLGGRQTELVTPESMTRMLSEILKRNPDIELVSLRSLPATGLTQLPASGAASGSMYRHGIEVTVSGTYFRMLAYLADLERNPARIFWGNLDLQANAYPKVTLKVTLFTLSPEKTWLLI
ncbi:MAG TPA: type II secretion system protein GspM [Burkholderiales bacterium]|nr:type II secretion system protein GspM [Burkholderiales bacterium]